MVLKKTRISMGKRKLATIPRGRSLYNSSRGTTTIETMLKNKNITNQIKFSSSI